MRHLITGGSGFLGNLIARRLLARGEQVRILDIWEDATRPREIEFVKCDILDQAGVAEAMRGMDVVHHNVALVPLTKSGDRFRQVNTEGSRLAAAMAAKAGVKAFIHMSSSALYGNPQQLPITAATSLKPVEIYGRAKLAGEQAVQQVCRDHGLPLIVIRPRTILGDGRLGIFQILFEWIREGRDVYTIGDGRGLFQFVHAHDLMDFYMIALDAGRTGIYNVGTDRFGTLREGLESLIRFAGTTSRVRALPAGLTIATLGILDALRLSPLAPWHYLTYHKPFHFDVSPLLAMGWRPRYSNDEMFQESYTWFQDHYDRLMAEKAGGAHRRPVKEAVLRVVKWLS
ncbi:MAG: NAD-dependent epimerase/dehydratase family protein [Magnetococcales bacterium]|nr:NAD-dependent epimerase/dehydratase family protein [Magnetococcales bacterium]MBF0322377.1 NAD-dependent epimerase/dehydratase family protein [Magnetococcales bacterium]